MPEHGIPVTLETPRGVFTFNAYGSPSYARLTGFSISAGVRAGVEPLAGRSGSIVPDAFRNGATPILKGEVVAREATAALSLSKRADLLDDLRAHGVAILDADGILRWTPSGQATRRMVVRCLEDPQDDGGFLKTFQLAFVSRSPNAEADVLKSVDTSAMVEGGGGAVEYPLEYPFSFGDASAGGSAACTNAGDAPAFPVVKIYGPIVSPALRNVTTGEALSLPGLVLAAGDFAEVDMRAETILYNGSPDFSLIGKLDPLTSDFFALVEGLNSIVLSGSGSTAATKATILFRDTFA